jgi:outer membrane protein TolC
MQTKTYYNKINFKIFFLFYLSFLIFNSTVAQTLDDYIQLGISNNSNLKAVDYDIALAKEAINEVGNYQNTNFYIAGFPSSTETRVGSQVFGAGISQKIPWFGQLKASKNLAKTKADNHYFDKVLGEKILSYQISETYFSLYEQQAKQEVLKNNKSILKTYENMAIAALSNNKATMSDVLKIRIQKNELHSRTFQTINTFEALSSNFNRLLEQNSNTILNIPNKLDVSEILIQQDGVDKHPILAQLKQEEKILEAENSFIQKDKKPKLNLGIDYVIIDKYTSNPIDNGKDIAIAKLGLSIPIFNKKYQSQLKQNALKVKQLSYKEKAQKIQLLNALEEAKLHFENALVQVLAAQKNQEEVQRALNVDLKAYETGILNYDKILKLQLQKIRYELTEIAATKKAFIAKAKIDYLTH